MRLPPGGTNERSGARSFWHTSIALERIELRLRGTRLLRDASMTDGCGVIAAESAPGKLGRHGDIHLRATPPSRENATLRKDRVPLSRTEEMQGATRRVCDQRDEELCNADRGAKTSTLRRRS